MFSMLGDIVSNIANFLVTFVNLIGADILFVIALGVEVLFVLFFLIKSSFSYEASLNRCLDKLNVWLFEKKVVTEDNIKNLNLLFKTKAPKRVCYYWQQYILFREGAPSSYLSTENLVEKPLKTSSYNSNIKNLSLFTTVWALLTAMFIIISENNENFLLGMSLAMALLVPVMVYLIGLIFVVYLRARKNAILNSLYQNVSLFGRFMDNACVDLPSYIDYQILFTPQEIEKGQPVLREFLDYKARKEKEEFNKAKVDQDDYETYDFSSTGVDGSIVLDRAMRESELFLKKKDKILVKISQLEAELDSRRKNFDNIQKDSQTKIQASKENVSRLRQMQEETTNRIESNYYRKQQTQEIAKQEQLEQEFEQQRAKYLLEKNEGEEEIKKLNDQLDGYKRDVQNAMLGEYSAFFNRFCKSAESVVGKIFADKFEALKNENEKNQEYITELEIKLKNIPQGVYDAEAQTMPVETAQPEEVAVEGQYDEYGNYVYPNGTYYDPEGYFHDEYGNVYSQDGVLISEAQPQQLETQPEEEKKVVDFDDFDDFDFMTDVSQKGDIYGVAENIVNEVNKEDGDIEIVNNTTPLNYEDEKQPAVESEKVVTESQSKEETQMVNDDFDDFALPQETSAQPEEEAKTEEPATPKKRPGRPRKIVVEEPKQEKKKPGRPRKVVVEKEQTPKRKVGRPKKIVKEAEVEEAPKRGRGRPRKQIDSISEINEKISKEEAMLNEIRTELNKELETAMNGMQKSKASTKQAKRENLIKEIETLQKEAQGVIERKESEEKISEINSKIEKMLEEIKKLS